MDETFSEDLAWDYNLVMVKKMIRMSLGWSHSRDARGHVPKAVGL